MDPLNQYDRYSYNQYESSNPYIQKLEPYLHTVAQNMFVFSDIHQMSNIPNVQQENMKPRDVIPDGSAVENMENNFEIPNNIPEEEIDSKEHLKPLLLQNADKPKPIRNKNRPRGRRSSYWNKKIADKDFAFYGCTICNISFNNLTDLDQHVTIHKGRITSYDIKLRNKKRKKLLKKQAKKAKKLEKKIKKEGLNFDLEIKPEDGYIGSDKAAEFQENTLKNLCVPPAPPINSLTTNTTPSVDTRKQIDDIKTNSVQKQLQNCPETSGNGSENTKIDSDNSKTDPQSSVNDPQNNEQLNSTNIPKNSIPDPQNPIPDPPNSISDPQNSRKHPKNSSNDTENGLESEDPRLQKLFKCFGCHKQFALSYYLKLHVRSHTDEKPYTCAVCGESFITASKLGRHNKRMHLSIKFTCRICYKPFNRFENLTRHFDKKHADDKLEGEPYDYNVILPYLKELEEQLEQKKDKEAIDKDFVGNKEVNKEFVGNKEVNKDKEPKPKAEELWSDNWSGMEHLHQSIAAVPEDKKPLPTFLDMDEVKQEKDDMYDDPDRSSPIDIVIEAMKDGDNVVFKTENVEVKVKDRVKGDKSAKDDSGSEEDYFPSNTWAVTPKPSDPTTERHSPKKRHKNTDYPIKCDLCEKTIATPGYMRVHMRIHTGEKPYKCYVCNRGFITSSKMHRHVLTHQEFWSDDDEKPLKTEDGIKKEKNDEKDGDKDTKKKDSIKRIKARINNTLREKKAKKREHACQFCGKRFLHKATMLVHQKCHKGEPLVLKCSFCLLPQPDEETQKTHEATHVGPKPYLCTECGRCYTKKESMVYHKKVHFPDDPTQNPPKNYICDVCSKGFNSQGKLQKHLVTHTMEKFVLRYECPVCAHMFNTKWHIQMHLQTHQREGVISEENRNEILAMVQQNARRIPLQPPLAGAATAVSNLVSPDDRSRVCNICGEMFQHFYYLEEHLKTHGSKIALNLKEEEGEKKHICPVCNKGFKLGYYLKLHSYTHTKEKPFICQTCGKGFITKGKLKRHLETHSGLKKYQCHVCHKFFTRPGYLRIHVRTIHGTQDYNFKYLHEQY